MAAWQRHAVVPLALVFAGCTIIGGVSGDYQTCGGAETWCPGVGCVDLASDARNCGVCSFGCPADRSCQASACACPTGATSCNNRCVDTAGDAQNCGMCGHACASGEACLAGACCAAASACGGSCVDLQKDPAHCGSCGNACTSTQSCAGGVCSSCGPGEVPCGAACAKTQTDSQNCGACGRSCGSEKCANGLCAPHLLHVPNDGVGAIAIDRQKSPPVLYWVGDGMSGGTMVGRIDLVGFTPQKLASTTTALTTIGLDGAGKVYWIEGPGTGSVVKSVTDDAAMTVKLYATAMTGMTSVAATKTDVYWTVYGTPGGVYRQPADQSSQPTKMAPTGAAMFGAPDGALVGTDKLYFFTTNIPNVYSEPLLGAMETVVGTGVAPTALALGDTHLYWSNVDGTLQRWPLAGGQQVLIASRHRMISNLAVDASGVYWVEPTLPGMPLNGNIMKAALDGSGITTLATGVTYPLSIALDATSVYWVDLSTIHLVPK